MKTILSMSISGGVMIAALLLLKPLLKEKLSKSWQYYIWLIVILRLLMPFSMEASVMNHSFAEAPIVVEQQVQIPQQLQTVITEPSAPQVAPVTPTVKPDNTIPLETVPISSTVEKPSINWRDIAKQALNYSGLLWAAVAAGLFVRKIFIYRRFVSHVKKSWTPVSDPELLDRVAMLAQQLGIKQPVELCISPAISTPMLIGFTKPRVLLPQTAISEEELEYTILHELTHYKWKDMLYKWLVQLTICLHWFNPLVYLMEKEISRSCELACDEAVIKNLDNSGKRAYGDTLINAAGKKDLGSDLASVTLSESGELLKGRLLAILHYRKMSKRLIALALALTLLLSACGTVLGAYRKTKEEIDPSISFENWNISHVEQVASKLDYGSWLNYDSVELKIINTGEEPVIYVVLDSSKDFSGKQSELFDGVKKQIRKNGVILLELFDAYQVQFRSNYGTIFHIERLLGSECNWFDQWTVQREVKQWNKELSEFLSDEQAEKAVAALTFPTSNRVDPDEIHLNRVDFVGHSLTLLFNEGELDNMGWEQYLRQDDVQNNMLALMKALKLSFIYMEYEGTTGKYQHIISAHEVENWPHDASIELEEIQKALAEDTVNPEEVKEMILLLRDSGWLWKSFNASEGMDWSGWDSHSWFGFVENLEADYIDAEEKLWCSQEKVETALLEHLDIDVEQLRKSTKYYDPQKKMYEIPAGWDPGAVVEEIYSCKQEDQRLYIKTGVFSAFENQPFMGLALTNIQLEEGGWKFISNQYIPVDQESFSLISQEDWDHFVTDSDEKAIMPTTAITPFMKSEDCRKLLSDLYAGNGQMEVLYEHRSYTLAEDMYDPYSYTYRDQYVPTWVVVLKAENSRNFDRVVITARKEYFASRSRDSNGEILGIQPKLYWSETHSSGWETDWNLGDCSGLTPTFGTKANWHPSLWFPDEMRGLLLDNDSQAALPVRHTNVLHSSIYGYTDLTEYIDPPQGKEQDQLVSTDNGIVYYSVKDRRLSTFGNSTGRMHFLNNERLLRLGYYEAALYDLSAENAPKLLMDSAEWGTDLNLASGYGRDWSDEHFALMYYKESEKRWNAVVFDTDGRVLHHIPTELSAIMTESMGVPLYNVTDISLSDGRISFNYYPNGQGSATWEQYAIDTKISDELMKLR